MPINSNALAFHILAVLISAGLAYMVYQGTGKRRLAKAAATFLVLIAGVVSITPLCLGHLIVSEGELLRHPDRYTSYVPEEEASIPVRVRAAYVLSLYELRASSTTKTARHLAAGILLTAADQEAQKALRPVATTAVAQEHGVGEQDLRRIAKMLQDSSQPEIR